MGKKTSDRMNKINKMQNPNSVHSVNSVKESPVPPLSSRLKDATRPVMVQVAPGKWVPNKIQEPPELSLCKWQTNGDGTFSPLPFTERMVRMNARLARLLGFPDHWDTLLRLGRAGFIELVPVSPHTSMLNLNSWYNHLRRCAEDPEFWDPKGANCREYRKNIF